MHERAVAKAVRVAHTRGVVVLAVFSVGRTALAQDTRGSAKDFGVSGEQRATVSAEGYGAVGVYHIDSSS